MPRQLGVTLRGGFGHALRELYCLRRERSSCAGCEYGLQCAYGYLFETPVAAEAEVLRRYPHAPHPFVLRPAEDYPPSLPAGAELEVGLVLIGRGADFLPPALLAWRTLGELGLGPDRARFSLERVRAEPDGGTVWSRGQQTSAVAPEPREWRAVPGNSGAGPVEVELISPLRLRVEGRVLRTPDFGPLVSAALRRLELLCRVHEAGSFTAEAPALARRAREVPVLENHTRWQEGDRYSRRQQARMPLGGLRGRAVYGAPAAEWEPLLSLAGRVHVGKGIAFGHGRLRARVIRQQEGRDESSG